MIMLCSCLYDFAQIRDEQLVILIDPVIIGFVCEDKGYDTEVEQISRMDPFDRGGYDGFDARYMGQSAACSRLDPCP